MKGKRPAQDTELKPLQINQKAKPGSVKPPTDPAEIVRHTIHTAEDKKAHNVIALDVRGLTIVADYFVIASTDNETAIRALSNAVLERLAKNEVRPWHIEGTAAGGWVVLDYGDVVVHVFHDRTREFYDLEGLWGDAPQFVM